MSVILPGKFWSCINETKRDGMHAMDVDMMEYGESDESFNHLLLCFRLPSQLCSHMLPRFLVIINYIHY